MQNKSESFPRRVLRVMTTEVPSRNLSSADLSLHSLIFAGGLLSILGMSTLTIGIVRGKEVDSTSPLGAELAALSTQYADSPGSLESVQALVHDRETTIANYGCEDESLRHITLSEDVSRLLVSYENRVNWTCDTDLPSQ